MPTTKTVKKQLTQNDVMKIFKELFDKEKIKNVNGDTAIKQDIRELNIKVDIHFRWLVGIMLTSFISMNAYFNYRFEAMNKKFEAINKKMDIKFDQVINAIHENTTNIKLMQKDIKNLYKK